MIFAGSKKAELKGESALAGGLVRRFWKNEDGSLLLMTLILFVVMLSFGGMAVDIIRHETLRAKIQYTIDAAVLAAADLDQTLEPDAVVQDYFDKAGLGMYPVTTTVTETLNSRRVDASVTASLQTLFMDRWVDSSTGDAISEINIPAAGAAMEGIQDIEISLVLDVSGSMNSNNRLGLLKTAAKSFVDSVIPAGATEENVSISIIPFATQVNAGADILEHFTVTNEHAFSNCINFDDSDFNSPSISPTDVLERTGHFDPWYDSRPPSDWGRVCHPASHREIMAFEHDPTDLKNFIDGFQAGGNTSIDIGTKWGLALLDPGSQHLVTAQIGEGNAHADFAGRPFAYNHPDVIKVLVVMSDGQNTSQYYLKPGYRDGASNTYLDENGSGTSDDDWSQYDSYYNDYYHWDSGYYYTYPDGGSSAVQLDYPSVWNHLSVEWWAEKLAVPAHGNSASHWESQVFSYHSGNTKNTRTSNICQQAKDNGVLVFTIGMETYGQGDATLLDCASSAAHFFDVTGIEISEAFNAIAAKINQLKLIQ